MSEEILKALTQLFAIITKQDGGVTEKERDFVIRFFQQELDQDSVKEYLKLYDEFVGYNKQEVEKEAKVQIAAGEEEEQKPKKRKLTSVKDSVKTLAICKKINKTLTQKQKVIVMMKTLELVASDQKFTEQRMDIIDTISSSFKFSKEEYKLTETFIMGHSATEMNSAEILQISGERPKQETETKHFFADIEGELIFLRFQSADMYFIKYIGQEEIVLNGFIIKPNQSYLFSHGSTVKTPKGDALYYSDLIRLFISDLEISPISFNALDLEYRFPNGGVGLRDINISEGPGKLIGIMGASGAGKTTLLNVLAGLNEPSQGEILINGYNIHTEKEKVEGVIGYISQDDLLIEELTVYQNLYYNAKLCFADHSEEEIHNKVIEVLESLGLEQRKDLKVGSVLDKKISGGQRKRLNIALELIREPAILFVDEPTSGLSSRDSENVIDLLKELSLKGKLIFVVIHQPSSDIYKMFDKMFLMDTGGYPIFYGHPVEAVTYFKKATNQVDSDRGQCQTCGNVNPEQIFNIVEARVVDEYGELTNKRKVSPNQWHEHFGENFVLRKVEDVEEEPPKTLNIPNKIKQSFIFTIRDTLSKISNKQYMLINLLEAPFLAIILALITKYRNSPDNSEYMFRFNENFPAFMLMGIVVALFMGLSVSAEEIIRDRKILKRESFLNLSWNSYLMSKLTILFSLSAIQTLSFVLIGNLILEVDGMTWSFWLILFSTSCFGNVLGLNVSSAFQSAVTVYILIPLLLIPQMILSGLLFPFDKLNNMISTKGKVPIIADMMASRWAYEAMSVYQFKHNDFEEPFYPFEQKQRQADFKSAYLIPKLTEKMQDVMLKKDSQKPEDQEFVRENLALVRYHLNLEENKEGLDNIDINADLQPESINSETYDQLVAYFDQLDVYYKQLFNLEVNKQDRLTQFYQQKREGYNLNEMKNQHYNESLADLVRNISVKDRILEHNGKLIQQIDPIFHIPKDPEHLLDYRTHFFAPKKHFAGMYFDTFYFNIIVIWLMTFGLYIVLYFEGFSRFLNLFGGISFGKLKIKGFKKS